MILFDELFCADCATYLLVTDLTDLCADCRALHPEMLLTYTLPLHRDLRAPWDHPINRNIIGSCGADTSTASNSQSHPRNPSHPRLIKSKEIRHENLRHSAI